MLFSTLTPTQGAGNPATSPKAQFPPMPSRGVAFWKAEDVGKLSWSALLSLAGVTLPCTAEVRLEANNQEQEQPKQSTSVCCTLKNMSMCQSRYVQGYLGLLVYSFTLHPCLLPPCPCCQMQVHGPFWNTVETKEREIIHTDMHLSLIKKRPPSQYCVSLLRTGSFHPCRVRTRRVKEERSGVFPWLIA